MHGMDLSPYRGLSNLLELVVPRVLEHYIANQLVELKCDCPQCRRDIAAFILCSLPPLYYGSLNPEHLTEAKIQWRTVAAEKVDQCVRRAIACIGDVPHHHRAPGEAAPHVETVTPEVVAERILSMLFERPLLEQLYGVPLPM
ncbi:MAG TPA: late competence development ComFB family protein, partial [Oscillatoriaceae cyanobacterium]